MSLLIGGTLNAFQYLRKDNDGMRYYQCLTSGTSGIIRIKEVAQDVYIVWGGVYIGKIKADTAHDAVRYACDGVKRSKTTNIPSNDSRKE